MDMHAGIWNRRKFLQVGAGMAAVAATGHAPANVFDRGKYYAVAAIRAEPSRGYLQSFIVHDRGWHPVDAAPARAPGSLSMHPALPVVYACHDVALWDHLPRGAVSAFRLSTANGTLQLMGTQPLSLGAIHPQAATVTAHGRSLVALTRSGVYNVLPLAADGSLLPVAAIRKEYGRTTDTGSKTAAPVHAVQHADGSLLAVDSGKETLSRFRLEADALAVQQRLHVHAGTGARQVALSSCGRWVYALHAQHASIACGAHRPRTANDPVHRPFQLLSYCRIGTPAIACVSRIRAAHSAGPVTCTLVPSALTATVTGISFTVNS